MTELEVLRAASEELNIPVAASFASLKAQIVKWLHGNDVTIEVSRERVCVLNKSAPARVVIRRENECDFFLDKWQ